MENDLVFFNLFLTASLVSGIIVFCLLWLLLSSKSNTNSFFPFLLTLPALILGVGGGIIHGGLTTLFLFCLGIDSEVKFLTSSVLGAEVFLLFFCALPILSRITFASKKIIFGSLSNFELFRASLTAFVLLSIVLFLPALVSGLLLNVLTAYLQYLR